MSHATVEFKDKGVSKLLEQIHKAGGKGLHAGLIDASPELVKIGMIHEYGAPEANIPQRSWLRSPTRENMPKYYSKLRQLVKQFVRDEISIDAVLYQVGEYVVGDIQKHLLRGIAPALMAATLKAKRRMGAPRPAVPLYRTGELFEAIKATVVAT